MAYANVSNDTQVFGGKKGFLILRKGRLYGLGDNSLKQISQTDEKEITEPCFIADNVIHAAVGDTETAYITAEGEVVLYGSGDYVKGFRGFHGATQIFYNHAYDFYCIRDRENRFFGFGSNRSKMLVDDESIAVVYLPVRLSTEMEERFNEYPLRVWIGCQPLNLPCSSPKIKKQVSYGDTSYNWRNVQLHLKNDDRIVFAGGAGRSLVKFPKVEDIALSNRGEYLLAVKDSNELLSGKIKDIYARDEERAILGLLRKKASQLSKKSEFEFFGIRRFNLP